MIYDKFCFQTHMKLVINYALETAYDHSSDSSLPKYMKEELVSKTFYIHFGDIEINKKKWNNNKIQNLNVHKTE